MIEDREESERERRNKVTGVETKKKKRIQGSVRKEKKGSFGLTKYWNTETLETENLFFCFRLLIKETFQEKQNDGYNAKEGRMA